MIRTTTGAGAVEPTDPLLRAVADYLGRRPEVFELDPAREGFDVRCDTVLEGKPNRARLKAFVPKPGILVVFLYKDSQVPFSDDRFSYGALVIKQKVLPEDELDAAVAYAATGLHPERRPAAVRRTFPFTVPR